MFSIIYEKIGGSEMNLEALKTNACSFCNAGDRCIELKPLPNGNFEAPLVPALVNYVFSIELYLKYLIAKEKRQYEGHELTKLFKSCGGHKLANLFNSIDSATQCMIIEACGYEKSEFESNLNKYSNVYVEWRYFYEGEIEFPIDVRFLKKFSYAVKSISNFS